MDMFNIFRLATHDFDTMLNMMGKVVYINGMKGIGIITTNPNLRETNDQYLSTNFLTKRGDIIFYENKYWMIVNQVGSPRYESFKALIRQVEHDITFNLYYAGVTKDYLLKCPAIVSRTSDFTQSFDRSSGFITIDSEIHVFVQDTPKTRKIMDLVNNSDGQVVLGERNYDIIGLSIEKKGVLDITCRMGNRNGFTDYENNIYWDSKGQIEGWETQYDRSFYVDKPVKIPEVPSSPLLPDATLKTNVGTISENMTTTQLTYAWSKEALAAQYAAAFAGYRVCLYLESTWSDHLDTEILVSADTLSHTFLRSAGQDFYITVESMFTDGTTTIYLKPSTSP